MVNLRPGDPPGPPQRPGDLGQLGAQNYGQTSPQNLGPSFFGFDQAGATAHLQETLSTQQHAMSGLQGPPGQPQPGGKDPGASALLRLLQGGKPGAQPQHDQPFGGQGLVNGPPLGQHMPHILAGGPGLDDEGFKQHMNNQIDAFSNIMHQLDLSNRRQQQGAVDHAQQGQGPVPGLLSQYLGDLHNAQQQQQQQKLNASHSGTNGLEAGALQRLTRLPSDPWGAPSPATSATPTGDATAAAHQAPADSQSQQVPQNQGAFGGLFTGGAGFLPAGNIPSNNPWATGSAASPGSSNIWSIGGLAPFRTEQQQQQQQGGTPATAAGRAPPGFPAADAAQLGAMNANGFHPPNPANGMQGAGRPIPPHQLPSSFLNPYEGPGGSPAGRQAGNLLLAQLQQGAARQQQQPPGGQQGGPGGWQQRSNSPAQVQALLRSLQQGNQKLGPQQQQQMPPGAMQGGSAAGRHSPGGMMYSPQPPPPPAGARDIPQQPMRPPQPPGQQQGQQQQNLLAALQAQLAAASAEQNHLDLQSIMALQALLQQPTQLQQQLLLQQQLQAQAQAHQAQQQQQQLQQLQILQLLQQQQQQQALQQVMQQALQQQQQQQPPPPPRPPAPPRAPPQFNGPAGPAAGRGFPLKPLNQKGAAGPMDSLPPCRANMAQLDSALSHLAASLAPGPEEMARQSGVFEAVKALLTKEWPKAKVHLFGSAANQLCIRNSNDIDVCLELSMEDCDMEINLPPASAVEGGEDTVTPSASAAGGAAGAANGPASGNDSGSQPNPNTNANGSGAAKPPPDREHQFKSQLVERLGQLLEEAGVQDLLCLPKARVPVVKCTWPGAGIHVDVTVNNMLALVNTHLLRTYALVDTRLRHLVFLVKHWAKQRNVNDSYRGTLSSYAYVLMCISMLQQRQPAVLPNLQALQPFTVDRTIGQWRCAFNDQIEQLQGFGAANRESLAELLVSFFDYWSWRHDYSNSVVSIRMGRCIRKAEKQWIKRVGAECHLVCIEDPFELSHDLGRTIDKNTINYLKAEFKRAADIMRFEPDPLPKLFEPAR